MKVTIGNMKAGAVGFGDGATVTGTFVEEGTGGEHTRPERPERPDRPDGGGASIVADSVEFGKGGVVIRGQR